MRARELSKNAQLAKVKPSDLAALDKLHDKTTWIYASLPDANALVRRAAEKLVHGFSFRLMTAYDLVMDFLVDDMNVKHSAVQPDMLFLLAGYSDPPNRQLANLLRYTMLERRRVGKSTWILTPSRPPTMTKIWGAETTEIIMSIIDGYSDVFQILKVKEGSPLPWSMPQ